jgi:hypothetical protein
MLGDMGCDELFVVALASLQAAERPQVAQVEWRECAPVTKLRISQYLWEQQLDQAVYLGLRHGKPHMMMCCLGTLIAESFQ